MTEDPQTFPGGDECADVAAYVLGALEPREAEAFAAHLRTCAACQQEVGALSRIADVLPLAVPAEKAPTALRERVLTQVRAEPKAVSAAPEPDSQRGPARTLEPERARGPGHSRTRSRRWWGSSAGAPARPALAMLLVAVVAVVTVSVIALRGPGAATPRAYRATVGDARLYVDGSRAELVVARLPQPGVGRIYEVWLQRGSAAPEPTNALFGVTRTGAADAAVPGNLRGVSRVLVTAEPAGGSLVPTSKPVIVTPLS